MTEPQKTNQVCFYLDLDGVLADFELHLHNCGKADAQGKPKWDELDHQWWATIPPCEGAKEFYDAVRQIGYTRFLSAPTLGTGCFGGKADWVQAFLPERGKYALYDLILCPKMDKQNFAGPFNILIDDNEKNVEEWVKAGGIGIHHTGDFAATMKKVKDALAKIPNVVPPTYVSGGKPKMG